MEHCAKRPPSSSETSIHEPTRRSARWPPNAWIVSRSPKNLSTVHDALRDKVFFSRLHWNSTSVDDQRIAALHDEHVFVEFMRVRLGGCRFPGGPESHLATFHAVEDIAFHSWGGLIVLRDLFAGLLHELRETIHVLRLCRGRAIDARHDCFRPQPVRRPISGHELAAPREVRFGIYDFSGR